MAFDAKQAVADKLTHLEDELKRARAKEAAEAEANHKAVSALLDEIAGWAALIEPEPPHTPPTDTPEPEGLSNPKSRTKK